eukprot:7058875-Pyramimonas_sp.AAC.1
MAADTSLDSLDTSSGQEVEVALDDRGLDGGARVEHGCPGIARNRLSSLRLRNDSRTPGSRHNSTRLPRSPSSSSEA